MFDRSKGDEDYVTFHRLTAYQLFLGSTYDWQGPRAALILYDQVLNSSSRDITWIYRKYANINNNSSINLSSICRFFKEKFG